MPYKDPEKQRAANKKYRQTHPDRVKAQRKRWREENRELYLVELSRKNKRAYARKPEAYAERYRNMTDDRRRAMLERQKARMRERLDFLQHYRAERGCRLCAESHPACLDFHHRDPSQKNGTLRRMKSLRMARILAEVEKCDVLCANCHRKLHASSESSESLLKG